MGSSSLAKLVEKAGKVWREWLDKQTELEPGTHSIKVKDLGPIQTYATHGSDQETFVVSEEGWVILLGEYMFNPVVSRWSIKPGDEIEIKVSRREKKVESATIIKKK